MLKVVFKDLIVRVDETGDILRFSEASERGPAGEDDVDEHEDLLAGSEDEDVSWLVVGALVGKMQGLVAYRQVEVVGECEGGSRTVIGGVGLGEFGVGVFMGNVGDVSIGTLLLLKEVGGTDVVCVGVTVDDVGDGEEGDGFYGFLDVLANGWGGVDEHDTGAGYQEDCLV